MMFRAPESNIHTVYDFAPMPFMPAPVWPLPSGARYVEMLDTIQSRRHDDTSPLPPTVLSLGNEWPNCDDDESSCYGDDPTKYWTAGTFDKDDITVANILMTLSTRRTPSRVPLKARRRALCS